VEMISTPKFGGKNNSKYKLINKGYPKGILYCI
jgi:hypothetical protein